MRAARAEAPHALGGGRHRVYNLIRGTRRPLSLTRSSAARQGRSTSDPAREEVAPAVTLTHAFVVGSRSGRSPLVGSRSVGSSPTTHSFIHSHRTSTVRRERIRPMSARIRPHIKPHRHTPGTHSHTQTPTEQGRRGQARQTHEVFRTRPTRRASKRACEHDRPPKKNILGEPTRDADARRPERSQYQLRPSSASR